MGTGDGSMPRTSIPSGLGSSDLRDKLQLAMWTVGFLTFFLLSFPFGG